MSKGVGRYAFRGAVAAMAMTGLRKVTTGLGLLEETPPEQIAEDTPLLAPILRRVPVEHHAETIELFHWAYGAAGGAAFAFAPAWARGRGGGLAYGLGLWVFFETGVVPVLGLSHAVEKTISTRVFVALDHALYGVVVAGEQ